MECWSGKCVCYYSFRINWGSSFLQFDCFKESPGLELETDVCRQCALTAQEYANHQNQKKKLETTSLLRSGHRRRMLALDSGHVSDVTSKSKLTKSIFEFFFLRCLTKQCETNRTASYFCSSTQPQALKGNGNQVNHFKCKLVFLQDEFRL